MLSDKPISNQTDDLLSRASFARQVALSLQECACETEGGFAAGLCGAWGSGRTSILNMVTEELRRKKHDQKKRGNQPLIVEFNPWKYPSAAQVTEQFFTVLAGALKQCKNDQRLCKAAEAMEAYTAVLRTDTAGQIKQKKKNKITVAELRAEQKRQDSGLPQNILKQKAKVAKQLSKQRRSIYVVMDDVDRMDRPRMRLVMRLISALADFPHMVYLLAFDEDVVSAALERKGGDDGRKYLEKFIQVVFTVPAPSQAVLNKILMEHLSAWIESEARQNYDPQYWQEIAPFVFACISNIRDIYRLINTLAFRCRVLGSEVNFVDLIAVTVLQLHMPKALPWIQTHRDDLLSGGGLQFSNANHLQRRGLKHEHRKELLDLQGSNAAPLLHLIGHLFPRYGRTVLDLSDAVPDARSVRMRRICCDEFFDLYFTMSPDALDITQKEILRSIHDMDETMLRSFTSGLVRDKRIKAYANQLRHYLADIPSKKRELFFCEVVWMSRIPEPKTPSDKEYQRAYFYVCCSCAMSILSRMGETRAVRCFCKTVETAEEQAIPILAVLLRWIQNGYPGEDSITMDEERIQVCTQGLLHKIRAFALEYNWLQSHKPIPVMEFWKQADAETFGRYLEILLEDDRNTARLISALTQRFDRDANMEYQFGGMAGEHAFSENITRENALAAIKRLRRTKKFARLPMDVQLDCVAFSMMNETFDRVTHRAVAEAYPDWEYRTVT